MYYRGCLIVFQKAVSTCPSHPVLISTQPGKHGRVSVFFTIANLTGNIVNYTRKFRRGTEEKQEWEGWGMSEGAPGKISGPGVREKMNQGEAPVLKEQGRGQPGGEVGV